MIIVTGNVTLKDKCLKEGKALCAEHVARSLEEPGCISHAFYAAPDNPSKIFFFEEWESPEAIHTHFAVPASQAFVKQLTSLASSEPQLNMYSAEKIAR